ncbi:MAG TPA: DNA circularization protein [Arsenophonus nasoniae]|uniref:DNA circularization protein n=1 Tax=Arsenophonus nasoniae TaxID=638 RepID=UPI0038792394
MYNNWKDRLQQASFRGVPFQVENDEGTFGRRVQVHEYPNRDKPYTEDLGRATRRFTINAYLIGDDFFEARDRLIVAIDTAGVGTLVHPYYGEIKVCIDGEVRVSHSGREGRMCRVSFNVVEAGELSFPTSGIATSQTLISSNSALNDRIGEAFSDFGLKGLPDFAQSGVLERTKSIIGNVTKTFDTIDSGISTASHLLQGDISAILKPSSSGKGLVEAIQRMWRSGRRTSQNASTLAQQIKAISGITMDNNLAPRGVWKSDRPSVKTERIKSNQIAAIFRTTAIHEATSRLTQLPSPKTTTQPSHPALQKQEKNNESITSVTSVTWEVLVSMREILNQSIDREQTLTSDDQLFLALQQVKTDVNRDIATRLAQVEKTITRTPDTVQPALVLAANWYDNAARESDITSRNTIKHSGFIPVQPLRVPVK